MNLNDREQVEAVWQRVRGSLSLSYTALADREAWIGAMCAQLYRLGAHRPTMKRLHGQAQQREKALRALAKLAGEGPAAVPRKKATADVSVLVRELGLAAGDYDPGHPIHGALFDQFRRECAQAQKAVLHLA